jgi:protein-S-isoprenylcysteine O-methyltransferase Ste14
MSSPIWDSFLRNLFTYRGYVYLLPFGLMAVIFYNEWEDDVVMWPLGAGIVLIGFMIRLWATKHIGRRMPWMKKKGKKLVRTGPYTIVRNPLYIGNIIIAGGLSVLSELAWFIPLAILYLFSAYHLVVLHEEKKLTERWGKDYLDYLKEVPRWVPKLKDLRQVKGGGFKWMDAIRSEIPSVYVILFSMVVFALKEMLE